MNSLLQSKELLNPRQELRFVLESREDELGLEQGRLGHPRLGTNGDYGHDWTGLGLFHGCRLSVESGLQVVSNDGHVAEQFRAGVAECAATVTIPHDPCRYYPLRQTYHPCRGSHDPSGHCR